MGALKVLGVVVVVFGGGIFGDGWGKRGGWRRGDVAEKCRMREVVKG